MNVHAFRCHSCTIRYSMDFGIYLFHLATVNDSHPHIPMNHEYSIFSNSLSSSSRSRHFHQVVCSHPSNASVLKPQAINSMPSSNSQPTSRNRPPTSASSTQRRPPSSSTQHAARLPTYTSPSGNNYPPPSHASILRGRPTAQQAAPAQPPAYTPSTAPHASSRHQTRQSSRTQQRSTPIRDSAAESAKALNLTRSKSTASSSRKNQRPWTLREFAFVCTIPKDISHEELQSYQFKFMEKFKWVPSEGQLRSQFWYFKRSGSEMRRFLEAYRRYEEGRAGVRQSESQLVTRLKMMTLRPRW